MTRSRAKSQANFCTYMLRLRYHSTVATFFMLTALLILALGFTPKAMAQVTFLDDFTQPDNADVGNGWIEKTPAAFALASSAVTKAVTGTGFRDNLVYRPGSESMLDGEASVEVRFTNSQAPGFPQIFVRAQMATIATLGVLDSYLLFINGDPGSAVLGRVEGADFRQLGANIPLNPPLNTTDTFRLRLRATGSFPVVLDAFVERFTGTDWATIGQATVSDVGATQITSPGTMGFSGHTEGGVYTYDNFTVAVVPVLTALNPAAGQVGADTFTLTATGSGFVPGSVLRWNGVNRPTTLDSPTQVRATIPSTDLAMAGTAQVTVFAPMPAGGGLSNSQNFFIVALPPGSALADDFTRLDNTDIGNGWIEKTPAAFALASNAVTKAVTVTGFRDNLVYRSSNEIMLDGEASVEVRFASLPSAFPQVFVRGQMATIGTPGVLEGYLLFLSNAPVNMTGMAILGRVTGTTGFDQLADIPLNQPLNTTDTFRLRLRVTGTNPVQVAAFVERFTGTMWEVLGQAAVPDAALTRIVAPGTVGFSGNFEGGVYTYDNFARLSLDAGIPYPVPALSALNPDNALTASGGLTLTVTGTNFAPTSVVRWNGVSRPTTFVSATTLQATIAAADIAVEAAIPVTVFTPAPGGGASNALTFTISGNPIPILTAIAPLGTAAGGANFTLTVTGDNFRAGQSVVRWNGANRPTTFVSMTQLTAVIPSTDLTVAGTAQVTVFNPTPGGGTSIAQNFFILQPGSTTFVENFNRPAGDVLGSGWIEKNPGAFALASSGVTKAATSLGFADNLVYRPASENALNVETSVEVRFASLPPGYPQVFVRGQMATITQPGVFDGYLLFIDNSSGRALLDRIERGTFKQLAQLTLNPQLNTTDTFRLRLRATGTSPVALSAFVERQTGPTTWAVIGQATYNDTAVTRFTTAGTVGFTGYTEGGRYTFDNFTRLILDTGGTPNPVPITSDLTPTTIPAGGAGFTLRVTGSNFASNSVVRWNGADRATTFRSATALDANITATDIAVQGLAVVTVFTPTPVGGTSNPQILTITAPVNPVPLLTAITPQEVEVGAPGFTLTVTGSNFVPGSVVRWNGAVRPTTFGSATQLTASIAAADIAAQGPIGITVFTQAPGGGTSNLQTLSVVPPLTFFSDNFTGSGPLGNGWITKNPAAFTRAGDMVIKAPTSTLGFADNLVYRPASENMRDGEVSIEVRFASLPPGYPQIFMRGQMATITEPGVFDGYLLFIDNDPGRARLDRIEGGAFRELAVLALAPPLNTTDTFRLRLRAMGTDPVVLNAFVERLTGTTWGGIGQATFNDTAATRFVTAGTEGFTGYLEGGVYTMDNFLRTSFDITTPDPTPMITALAPRSAVMSSPGVTLTVTGSNFVPGSVIRWDGMELLTTFISSTQLQALIPATDLAMADIVAITVLSPALGGLISSPSSFFVLASGGSFFFDDFNRPDAAALGNGWTEKFPNAFAIQTNEVVSIDTTPLDYHDTTVTRPVSEDQDDVEVGIEFRLLPGLNFPQVHARAQRATLAQPDTLEDYIFFVDGEEPSPGRAIIAIQPPVTGLFECYMLAIPFPSPLQQTERYRLRFRVSGTNPVLLTGTVEQFDGAIWQVFASGMISHDANTPRTPTLFCDSGTMPPPITTVGAVGFAKWTTNNEVYDNFFWVSLPTP